LIFTLLQTWNANTSYSVFGSCFYVLDFKGTKGLTRVANGPIFTTQNPSDESNGTTPRSLHASLEENADTDCDSSDRSLFGEATPSPDYNSTDDSLFGEATPKVKKMTMETAAQESFDQLWERFPILNKDYMLNQANGQVFFDLGIGFHPIDQNLAGVWRLEHMEASFGGAGYKRGTAHPLNTLWEVGGLMAEMRKKNREASHIVYQVAYSTTYEPFRKKDNEVSIFAAPDVVGFSHKFLNDYKTVQHILDGVMKSNRSYGVRREFRIGGDALQSVFRCLDVQVSTGLPFYPAQFVHMTQTYRRGQ
jgi:hypothetical protein